MQWVALRGQKGLLDPYCCLPTYGTSPSRDSAVYAGVCCVANNPIDVIVFILCKLRHRCPVCQQMFRCCEKLKTCHPGLLLPAAQPASSMPGFLLPFLVSLAANISTTPDFLPYFLCYPSTFVHPPLYTACPLVYLAITTVH